MKKYQIWGCLALASLVTTACSRYGADCNKPTEDSLADISNSFYPTPTQEPELDPYVIKARMESGMGFDAPMLPTPMDKNVHLYEPVDQLNMNVGFSPVGFVLDKQY